MNRSVKGDACGIHRAECTFFETHCRRKLCKKHDHPSRLAANDLAAESLRDSSSTTFYRFFWERDIQTRPSHAQLMKGTRAT